MNTTGCVCFCWLFSDLWFLLWNTRQFLSLQATKKVFKWINLRYFLRSSYKSEQKSLENHQNKSTNQLKSKIKGTVHATIKNIYFSSHMSSYLSIQAVWVGVGTRWLSVLVPKSSKNTKTQQQFLSFLGIMTRLSPVLCWQVLFSRKKIIEQQQQQQTSIVWSVPFKFLASFVTSFKKKTTTGESPEY